MGCSWKEEGCQMGEWVLWEVENLLGGENGRDKLVSGVRE